MKIIPFEVVMGVPTGRGGNLDVRSTSEFIDIADTFTLEKVRGIRKPYYTGLTAFMFDSQLKFSFDRKYELTHIEFSRPFSFLDDEGLYLGDINLLRPTILDVQMALHAAGVETKEIDVGLEILGAGVSFFSSDYEGSLDVRVDAVTVCLSQPG